jgi:hypothetical protein
MTQPVARPSPDLVHVGPDGTVFRPQLGDQYLLRGNCPNRCGPMQSTPGRQRCPACGFNTNITPMVVVEW